MDSLKNTVNNFSKQYKELKHDAVKAEKSGMPAGAFFLENNHILTLPRNDGDSRYRYGRNGFNFWTYSSGYMHSNDGLFTQFIKAIEGQEPRIAFFAGIAEESGRYDIISLLPVPSLSGALNNSFERYVVFAKASAYYFTENSDWRFSIRIFPDEQKCVNITLSVQNLCNESKRLFISTYLNPFMVHSFSENVENRWFREARFLKHGEQDKLGSFVIKVNEDISRTASVSNYGVVNRCFEADPDSLLVREEITTSRYQYVGGSRASLHNPEALRAGSFGTQKQVCAFTDIGIAGDMLHMEVAGSGMVRYDSQFCYAENCIDKTPLENMLSAGISAYDMDRRLAELEADEEQAEEQLSISVKGSRSQKIKDGVFNPFVYHLKKQVEFCSLVKGYIQPYSLSLIGVRDIFQSLEGLIFWKPEAARDKISEALNFIFTNGRTPRQYSLPRIEGQAPDMDLRPFIDQGVWIISTIYTYLKVTGDMEFLSEECGYYEIVDERKGLVARSQEKDSVLGHMFRIMDYLLSNRDFEETGCIRALYGDWNDALDGLGVSSRAGVAYGTGVSVMASLQVYQNLSEMVDLLVRLDETVYSGQIASYREARKELEHNLRKYAVIADGNGELRILHGWGDQRSYFVGSFDDSDHCSRHGLTSNAFWVLSGLYDINPGIKEAILNAFKALDSKYGYKTFVPHFSPNTPGVGRIPKLPAGTAENGAAYIHATAFAAMALYRMGHSEEAWEQLVKILPFTHEKLSHSPFVMPNSYVFNEELLIDGESMGDWQTGSSNVLVKTLIRYVFGLEPELSGIWIQTASWVPFKEFEFSIYIKGCNICLRYKNMGSKQRKYSVNGVLRAGIYNEIMGLDRIWLPEEELKCRSIEIEIED